MKKFFCYEWKKNIWTTALFTVLLTSIYVICVSTMEMVVYYEYSGSEIVQDSCSAVVGAMMILLCFLVPVLNFSFKMSKRGVDAFYALPLKKEKLYFVKAMVGLLQVVVPYTIAYWAGFFVLLFRQGNPYVIGWYVPLYFGELLFAVCLYGINVFLFTRANRTEDGVVFMLAYIMLGYFVVSLIEAFVPKGIPFYIAECFYTFGGQIRFEEIMGDLIRGYDAINITPWMFIYPIVLAAIAYFLLFFNLRYERGENAEQPSDSWFGYRFLIPAYLALAIAMSDLDLLTLCVYFLGGVTALVVYRRKIKFSWKYWLLLAVGIVVGVAIAIIRTGVA